MFRRKIATLTVGASLLFGVASCASQTSDDSDSSAELTVFAAASLSLAFEDIGEQFAKQHPDASVNFSYAGSSSLVSQIGAGAPADVFASADEQNMAKAADHVPDPVVFTENTLRLVVPTGNPAGIESLSDLDGAKLVVCAPQVPCGRVTGELEAALDLNLDPVSEEQSVTDVRTKVEIGEADAGFVYVTDAVAASDKLEVIDIDGVDSVSTKYMIGMVSSAQNKELAQAFIDIVMSEEGQDILAEYGFDSGVAH